MLKGYWLNASGIRRVANAEMLMMANTAEDSRQLDPSRDVSLKGSHPQRGRMTSPGEEAMTPEYHDPYLSGTSVAYRVIRSLMYIE